MSKLTNVTLDCPFPISINYLDIEDFNGILNQLYAEVYNYSNFNHLYDSYKIKYYYIEAIGSN